MDDRDHRFYGVDVRVYSPPKAPNEDKLSESELNTLWERGEEVFWARISDEAAAAGIGVDSVYRDGRSGGWAVPEPVIDPRIDGTRFKEFENLCDLLVADMLENWWPEAVADAIKDKEEAAELAACQTKMGVTLTWNVGALGDKPNLHPEFIERIFVAALEANGLQNFELDVEEES